MVNLKLLVLAALVALAVWWLLSPSEERRVRRVFDRASELIAKDSGARDNVYAEFIKSLKMNDREFVRSMLEEFEQKDCPWK